MKDILELKVTIDGKDGTGKISDGYHTFDELYEHRITLFLVLCKKIEELKRWQCNIRPLMWKSKLHSDGTNFDGWFIAGINVEEGEQITYHIPMSRWGEANFMETLDQAPKFDGHTSQDVINRLQNLL